MVCLVELQDLAKAACCISEMWCASMQFQKAQGNYHMFRYKAIGQKSTITRTLRSGKSMDKTVYEKRVIAKSGPPHVKNVGSGKSQYLLNKRMLPFLGTATLYA